MKLNNVFLIISLALITFWSCQKYEAEQPVACIDGPTEARVGVAVEFTNCSTNSSFGSFWPGDATASANRAYANLGDTTIRDSRGRLIFSQGIDLAPGITKTHTYATPGVYTVTLIATSDGDWGQTVNRDIVEYEITITP
jgi:hypothetical protein